MPKILGAAVAVEGKTGSRRWTGPGRYVTTYGFVYTILGDSVNDTADDILNTAGLPPLGGTLNGTYVVGYKAKEKDTHALLWEVEAELSSEAFPDISSGTFEEDPTDLTPTWEWDFELLDQVIEVEKKTGDPIENSAGERIIEKTEIALPVLTITRIQESFDPDVILDYVNYTNETAFWGAPPTACLMTGIRDRRANIDQTELRSVTYQIKFNLALKKSPGGVLEVIGWRSRPLDQGSYYLDGTDKISFLDENGNAIIGNLDGSGGDNGVATPEYLNFAKYPETDFNTLALGPY